MTVPELSNPDIEKTEVTLGSVPDVVKWASDPKLIPNCDDGYFPGRWLRGQSDSSNKLLPRVYRPTFRERAKDQWLDHKWYKVIPDKHKAGVGDLGRQCLNLERRIFSQFLQAGGHLLERDDDVEAYFLARHYGLPTQLLDWSTNPLIALFMAVDGDPSKEGAVFAMDPTAHLRTAEPTLRGILTPGHPHARHAIKIVVAWEEIRDDYPPHILAIRPNTRAGRIERQSSCFTLHSYGAGEAPNPTLRRCKIPHAAKSEIRSVLSSLGINQFTVYNTLDRLSREFDQAWKIQEP